MLTGRRITVVVLLIGLVGALWVLLRGHERTGESEESAAESNTQRAELLERKKAARAGKELDLRPCSVSGRVIEVGGGGIAGAVVQLVHGDDEPNQATGEARRPAFAVTDAQGNWSIPATQPGTYLISAAAAEHVPGQIDGVVLAAATAHEGIEITLAPGGLALTGTVSDYGGGPVEGVLVSASSSAPLSGPNALTPSYAALTDAQGHYQLWLADRRHRISTWHLDYASESESVSMRGRAQIRDFKLIPGAVVEGTVVEASTGKPVAGADLLLTSQSSGRTRFWDASPLQSGADGKFTFRQLHAGVLTLRATAPGLATVTPTEVQLAIGQQVAGVEVRLDQAVDVSGFVVRKDDPEQGVAGAKVHVFSLREGGQYESMPSEADGYFVIHGVAPGEYSVSPTGDGILGDFLDGSRVTVEDTPVDDLLLEVELGVEIRGRVEPPTPVHVSVRSVEEQTGMAQMRSMFRQGKSYSSADGSFRVIGAEPGHWKLVASAVEGDGKAELEVDVPAEGLDDVVIELRDLPRITGRVVDLDGNPLPELSVVLEDQSKSTRERREQSRFFGASGNSGITEQDGSFEIVKVEDGEYLVKVVADRDTLELEGAAPEQGGIPLQVANGVGVDGLQLKVLVRRGRITGRVLAAGGGPALDVWVTARRKSETGPSWWAREDPALTDVDGRFVLDELEDGRYELEAEAADGGMRGKLEAAGLGEDVVIQLESPARITGTVRKDGAPVTDFMFELSGDAVRMGMGGKRVVNPKGEFAAERLDPGGYAVLVSTDDGSAHQTVEVEAGEHATVELNIVGWGKVTGTAVSAETGEPLAGLNVMATSSGGSKRGDAELLDLIGGGGNKTDASGKFELEGLGEGRVLVEFMTGDLFDSNELGGAQTYLEAGKTVDLGRVRLLDGEAVPEKERGDLGLITVADVERPSDTPRGPTPDEDARKPQHLWVYRVHADGPAAKAGIEKHTEILAVDGKSVAEYGASIPNALLGESRVRKGQKVQLTLEGGKNVVLVAE